MFGKSLGEPFSDIACMDLLHWLVLGRHYEPVRAIIMTWSIESWLMWALIWSVLPPLPYLPASSQPPEKISCSIWRYVSVQQQKNKKLKNSKKKKSNLQWEKSEPTVWCEHQPMRRETVFDRSPGHRNLYLLFGTFSAAHSQSNFVTFNFEIFPLHLPKATTSSTDSTLDRATFYH